MRRRVTTVVVLLALASCTSPTSSSTPPDIPARPLSFAGSGLTGGGFVNVIAVDPADPDLLLAGGDVGGFHRSTDGGATWRTANAGLTGLEQLSVAAIAFAPGTPGLVYGAVGVRGAGGGVVASTDGGVTWALRSATPRFSGSNNEGVGPIPPVHPRSTGELLAVGDDGEVYAATFDQGVLRSTDGGATWTTLGLEGRFLRGLAFDPAEPDVLFAAVYGEGVFRTDDANGAGGFVAMRGSPDTSEELSIAGSTLYAAAGASGLWAMPLRGSGWIRLGAGQLPEGATWLSVRAERACGRDVVVAGSVGGPANGVVRSEDGGASWTTLTDDPSAISTVVGGSDGPSWWLAPHGALLLGGRAYVAADIATAGVTDCLAQDLYVAGRAGVWGSHDAGRRWAPLVAGLGGTIARDVAADPRSAGRAFVATADWVFFHSDDGLATVHRRRRPGGTTAPDIAIDISVPEGLVSVATGFRSANAGGEVYSSPDPATVAWIDEGLSSTAAHGRRPLAIAVRTIDGERVLIAAVEGAGIWRKVGATWSQVESTAMASGQPSRGASLTWAPGSSSVFLFDRRSGVWRSTDDGATWALIWRVTSPAVSTGFVLADPTTPGRLFVSVGGTGVFRIDDADQGSVDDGTLTPVEVGGFAAPGPLAHDGTALLATETAAPGVRPELRRSVDDGTTWAVISDDAYAAAALVPSAVATGPDGWVAVATNGDGVLVGTPSP